ncbi:hypothetical protein MNBD_GAMMA22-1003 [hydrothermal vent metagenome]|uniref:AbiEi antitoxin N-terminal domain-containing protein n=1 Tax=hydrothermal vent metagenome TaxID=652676 RepID=A0A3B1AR46_9ZZZZ
MIKDSVKQQVINIVRSQLVVRPKDFKAFGLPKDYLYLFEKEGIIERVGRGLYQWPNKDLRKVMQPYVENLV